MVKYYALALAITLAAAQPAVAGNLVINGGFETVYDTTGPRPTGYGYWQGNFSEIVPASQGITPIEGSHMLNFIYTIESGPALTKDSEVWQIIDVSSSGPQISAAQAMASASFHFNRVDGDAETDTEFTIGLYAYAGDPCSFPSQYETSELAARLTSVFSDGDPNTWELATVDLILPPNTDFLVVESAARENVFNDASDPELDGHYADAVSVTICSRPIIYVDADANGANDGSSWENAFNYLQDALAGALYGDEIWVAEGVYKPDEDSNHPDGTGNKDATFQLIDGVAVRGGYAGSGEPEPNARDFNAYETVLSGDLNGDDAEVSDPLDMLYDPKRGENSYFVVFGEDTDQTATLDGFSITNGHSFGGSGIYIGKGNATITNCRFSKNLGLHGGGMLNWGGSPKVKACTFSENLGLWGGGIYNSEDSNPVFIDCVFTRNVGLAQGGGLFNFSNSSPMLVNCRFIANRSDTGGGVYNYGSSSPAVVNCTLSGNEAYSGGGMYNSFCNPKVTNCIIWGNTAFNGAEMYGGATVNYSDVRGGYWPGQGNIDADPCFVEPGYWDANGAWVEGNYHLLPSSPCIDAGDNNSVPEDTADLDGDGNTTEPIPWDLDGNPRIADSNNDGKAVVDMGAYEYFVPPIEVAMKFTPQALNPGSKGKWVKAHFVLPEEYTVEEVDVNTPAVVQPGDIESDYINVFVNEEGLVGVEAAFGRREFCGIVTDGQPMEVSVTGSFISGQQFYGIDTIKITTNTFEYLAVLASHWLEDDCGKPDWCGGADLDEDSTVNFRDFVLFDGCCIEIITE
jgi:hypothetical protein